MDFYKKVVFVFLVFVFFTVILVPAIEIYLLIKVSFAQACLCEYLEHLLVALFNNTGFYRLILPWRNFHKRLLTVPTCTQSIPWLISIVY